mgnify:CR=1 FL=1
MKLALYKKVTTVILMMIMSLTALALTDNINDKVKSKPASKDKPLQVVPLFTSPLPASLKGEADINTTVRRTANAQHRTTNRTTAQPLNRLTAERGISYLRAFSLRQTWALVLGRFLTDGVWWFFLFWTPGYLSDQFGYKSSDGMGMALIFTLYAIVTFVSIYLCKLPTYMVDKKGMNPYEGRMVAMFVFACFPLLALGAQPLGSVSAWFPAILIGFACAGHQAWSANVYSVVGDMFPKSTIGTLTGIAQFAAGCGSFMVNKCAGALFTYSANQGDAFTFCGYSGKPAGYMIVFSYCAVAYVVGWICMKSLVPHYKRVEL